MGPGELELPEVLVIVPPTGRALASKGRAGKTVKLVSAIADDEGTVSLVEQIKRNGRVTKTIRRAGSVVATSPKPSPLRGRCPPSRREPSSTAPLLSTRRETKAPRAARGSS